MAAVGGDGFDWGDNIAGERREISEAVGLGVVAQIKTW